MQMGRQLKEFDSYIARKDWNGLEKSAKVRCSEIAGKEDTARIASINLESYEKELGKALKSALRSASNQDAPAIYFEYDMDNNWDGVMCVCAEYRRAPARGAADDDWASDIVDEVDVRGCAPLARLYESSFEGTRTARGINGYLIARTIAAFGRVCSSSPLPDIAVCIGFHDQGRVTRIKESESRKSSKLVEEEAKSAAKAASGYFRWQVDRMTNYVGLLLTEIFPYSRKVDVTDEDTGKRDWTNLSVLDEGIRVDPKKYKPVTAVINSRAQAIKPVAEITYWGKVISRKVAEVVADMLPQADYQLLPLRIENINGKLLSEDYVILNCLRWVDCLDLKNSVIERIDKIAPRPLQIEIETMCEWHLLREAIPADAIFFRPEGCFDYYIVREDLAKKMIAAGVPKRNFEPVSLSSRSAKRRQP